MRKSLFTVFTFARINTRRFFRDRLSIFFGIMFPLIFLFVFGGIFGSNDSASFRVALINNSSSPFATNFVKQLKDEKSFKVDESFKSLDDAKELMTRSQLDAAVILPREFGAVDTKSKLPKGDVQVYYTQNNAQAGQTLTTILNGAFKDINAKLTKTDSPFSVKGEQLNDRSLTQFDYTFAGLLGFALLGVGIFGPVNVFPELKKQGILRRLSTTPLKVWQYFSSIALSQAVIGLVSVGIMFVTALLVFKLEIVGNPLLLIGFIVFSIIEILGIGLAIGGWARNERQAAPLSNIVVFPMMFLSGTFFPRFLMPEWLQHLSAFLPLTPVIDGLRYIINEGYGVIQLAPQLGLMAAWIVIIYIIAFRVFRWE
ncbi:MAG TPA: ABC transporter permease [Patescibacteria group bacterium]|jgi:ABC-2 type transport system permease protein|nr:ABC transporter permease [Patescibacteria group bacterium]